MYFDDELNDISLYLNGYDSNEVRIQEEVQKFEFIQKNINWKIKEDRIHFLWQFASLVSDWTDQYPNLRNYFPDDVIECLLLDCTTYWSETQNYTGSEIISFVARTGYKNEPKFDIDGKPLLRRTTPVHHAIKCKHYEPIHDLFTIYDSFDVNYVDESGLTHFHVACMLGCTNVVEKFLQLGQDPNIRVPETGNSPLHLAVYGGHKATVELLLRNGANLNSANMDGSTPLHMICKKKRRFDLLENLFKISNDRNQPVQVDARDKLGRTPLQLAVANLLPHVVDVLLQHGADLSNFSFPDESYFAENVDSQLDDINFKLKLASGALATLEGLEKKGYELDQIRALTIMKFFAKYELFESADLDKRWYDNEKFARVAKNKTIRHELSLYDLFQLRPEEENKLLSYSDYFEFAQLDKLWPLPIGLKDTCLTHMCEIMSRRFFQRFALDPFWALVHKRLPIECCEIIIQELKNEDLYKICLAENQERMQLGKFYKYTKSTFDTYVIICKNIDILSHQHPSIVNAQRKVRKLKRANEMAEASNVVAITITTKGAGQPHRPQARALQDLVKSSDVSKRSYAGKQTEKHPDDEQRLRARETSGKGKPTKPVSGKFSSPERGDSSSDTSEIELCEEILEVIGKRIHENRKLAPALHSQFAEAWKEIIEKGLPDEKSEEISKKYDMPKNCTFSDPPRLNPEIKAALGPQATSRDDRIAAKQKKINTCLANASKMITYIISENKDKENVILVDCINDLIMLLADLNRNESMIRKNIIMAKISPTLKETLSETKYGEFLFGEKLDEVLKSTKALDDNKIHTSSIVGRVIMASSGQEAEQRQQPESSEKESRLAESTISNETTLAADNVSVIAGRLRLFVHKWNSITKDKTVLSWLTGYRIRFDKNPVQKSDSGAMMKSR
uniref:Uncharacterized protein n=1 Tax=Trichogramma kaykai TaxID=54128 RepID=A0ABD2WS03_9HYME